MIFYLQKYDFTLVPAVILVYHVSRPDDTVVRTLREHLENAFSTT